MNIRLILHLLSSIMLVEGAAMVPSLLLALVYADGDATALLWSVLITIGVWLPFRLLARPSERRSVRVKASLLYPFPGSL